jgi:Proteobacterial transcriptional regulator-like domain
MSDLDWRSPETYAKLQTAEAADFAWEYFRRNRGCREDYRTRPNTISDSMRLGELLQGSNRRSLQFEGRSIGAVARDGSLNTIRRPHFDGS